MKIYWDSYGLRERGSGVSHYADHLADALSSLDIYPQQMTGDRGLCERMSRIKLLRPLALASQAKALAGQFPHETVVVHGLSNFNTPLFFHKPANVKTVLTIHDLIPLIGPSLVSWTLHRQLQMLYPRLLPQVDVILCDSQWTRQTVTAFFPGVSTKIQVLGLGYPPVQRGRGAYPLLDHQPLRLLSIGRHEPYKNLALLGEMAKVSENRLRITLITDTAGQRWAQEIWAPQIQSGAIVVKCGLNPTEMAQEFQNADVYCHTSLFEGFGLPLAEAAAWGLPVVFLRGSATEETAVAGYSVALEKHQPANEWVLAAIAIGQQARHPDFQEGLWREVEKRQKWSDVASELAKIYTALSRNKTGGSQ